MIRRPCLLSVCLMGMTLMAGCGAIRPAVSQDEGQSSPEDFVESRLVMAAEDIQTGLRQLIGMERKPPAYQPLTPPATGDLAVKPVVSYDCSVRWALSDAAARIGNGWTLRETGRPPVQEVIVHTSSDGARSWFELLEDMGWQTDDRADIHVSEPDKTIVLAWQGMSEPQAQVANHKAPALSPNAKQTPAPGKGKVTLLYGVRKLLPAGWRYRTEPSTRNLPVSLRDNSRDWRSSLRAMAAEAGVKIHFDEENRRVTVG